MRYRLCIIVGLIVGEINGFAPPSRGAPANAELPSPSAASAIAPPSTDSTEEILKKVRLLINRQQYRASEKLLVDRLAQSGSANNETLEAALGEVYFCSGQNDKAVVRLKQSLERYAKISPSTVSLLREESRVAALLADTYSRQLLGADATAALQRSYARYQQQAISDPATQIDLLSRLAALGETSSGPQKSASSVDQEMTRLVEQLQTNYAHRLLTADDYFQGMARLAKYQSAVHHYDQAAATLQNLITQIKSEHGSIDPLSLRLQLADVYKTAGKIDSEIEALKAALADSTQNRSETAGDRFALRPRQRYLLAETECRLADAWQRNNDRSQSAKQLALALQDYASLLRQQKSVANSNNRTADNDDIPRAALLERLVDVNDQHKQLSAQDNLPLNEDLQWHRELLDIYQQALLADDVRIARLKLSLAGLYLEGSDFQQARAVLQQMRDDCSRRTPINVSILAKALTMLAECDLAIASRECLTEAAEVLAQAAEVTNGLPADDDLRSWVRLNLGRLKAAQGQYRQALAELEQIASDQAPQRTSSKLRSLALLYLGLLYKEQLKLDQSLQFCRQALEMRQSEVPADSPDLLRYYLALSELYIARHDDEQNDLASLADVIQHAQSACRDLPDDHPNRATVLHQQAMLHYLNDKRHSNAGERQAAREVWEHLANISERTGQQAMQARALHYLARLDYLDWTESVKAWNQRLPAKTPDQREFTALKEQIDRFNDRQKTYEANRQKYRQTREGYDQSSDQSYEDRQRAFETIKAAHDSLELDRQELDRLAADLNQQRQELLKSHDELVSHDTALGAQDRRRWTDLLEHGEQLEQQALEKLQAAGIYPSLQHAILCNQAQILEAQSQIGGDRRQLLDRALTALREAVSAIEDPRAATFAGDFMRAEFFAQYQSAFDLQVRFLVQAGRLDEALIAAEQGRSRTLLDQLWPDQLSHSFPRDEAARIVDHWRNSHQPLLYYYVGGQTSYLFVLGGVKHEIQLFRLKVPAGFTTANLGSDASGIRIAECVARLRDYMRDEHNARSIAANADVRQMLAGDSAILLPPQAVEYLRQESARGANCVTIVPHGAISQLPLEALIVDADSQHPYLLDCIPPIVYAPSLLVLSDLQSRPGVSSGTPTLLTVADPIFAPSDVGGVQRASFQVETLAPLPESGVESRHIADIFTQSFGEHSVLALAQASATEERFRKALAGRFTFLHLATHGMAGDDQGEPYGRIVLSLSSNPTSTDNDGYLDLDEIRSLNLSSCELTVLSACKTNIGATLRNQRKQHGETASPSGADNAALRLAQTDVCFSLASAFLAAGSRRVLATQWEVADPSTSVIITAFFTKVARETKAGHTTNYAKLLAEARNELRCNSDFDSPFHWAAFVLIGPAETLAKSGD